MENENQKEEQKEESTVKLIDMVDRLEKANEEAKEILRRQEEIVARNLLGGQTEAGQTPEKKEESPQEYAKRVLAGKV